MTARPITHHFDPTVLDQLWDLDETPGALVIELLQLFNQLTPERLTSLEAACQGGNRATIRQDSHTLKSSAANLGAMSLSALCAKIEVESAAGDLRELLALAHEARSHYLQSADALVREIARRRAADASAA